jgi:hypothetical protein
MPEEEYDSLVDEVQQTVKQAVGDRLLLAKMEAAEKTAVLAGKLMFAITIAGVSFFVFLFISLMAGYYFSQVFESFFIGFAIVAGVYLLLLILLFWKGKTWIASQVQQQIISTIFHEEDEAWEAEHPNQRRRNP